MGARIIARIYYSIVIISNADEVKTRVGLDHNVRYPHKQIVGELQAIV